MRTHRESWEPGKQMPLRYLGIAKLDRADGVGHPIGTDVERIGKAAPRADEPVRSTRRSSRHCSGRT